MKLPAFMDPALHGPQLGVQSVRSVIDATARAAQGSQNLGKALFSPRKCTQLANEQLLSDYCMLES